MYVTLCIKGFREISTCWFHQWLNAAFSAWFPELIYYQLLRRLWFWTSKNIFCWKDNVKESLETLTDLLSFAKVSSCKYIECLAYEAAI